MTFLEKVTTGSTIFAVCASAVLYGIWEDKATLYAPLLAVVYVAIALWLASGKWRGTGGEGQGRQPSSDFAQALRPEASLGYGRMEGSQSAIASASSEGQKTEHPTFHIPHFTTHSIPPGGIMLLLFCLYSFALVPFSVLPYEAKISSISFGAYLAVYWASANILSRFSYRKVVWVTVFVLMMLVALYSLVQHRVAPNLIFGVERYTDYWKGGRLGGTYQCPNHIAHLFQMWIPFCLVFLFIPQFGLFWRICFAYAIPLFLLLIYQTQSRAGLLGSVAAVGTTVLFMILRKSRRTFMVALLVVPLLGAAALGGLWVGSSMFRERMQPVVKFINLVTSGEGLDENFNDFRPLTWLDTLKMIKDRPVFGAGPGNYGLVYEDYRTRLQTLRMETVHPHNEYLELTAEYGLVGAGLVLLVLISISVQLIRFIRKAERSYHALPVAALLGILAGTAVHGFFDFELRIFPNALMLALLAGCVAAPLLTQRKTEDGGRRAEGGRRKGGGRRTDDG